MKIHQRKQVATFFQLTDLIAIVVVQSGSVIIGWRKARPTSEHELDDSKNSQRRESIVLRSPLYHRLHHFFAYCDSPRHPCAGKGTENGLVAIFRS